MDTPNTIGGQGWSVKAVLPDAARLGGDDLLFSNCSGDWQVCQPGDLYVAIDSEAGDGHEFVHAAIERGAVGVVTERLLAVEVPQFLVEDTRQAFGRICQTISGQPSLRLKSCVVSGSDGRTVTSHLLESILKVAGLRVGLCTSLQRQQEIQIDRSAENEPGETPSGPGTCAARLAEWMSEQVLRGHEAIVLETSNEALAHHTLAGSGFDVAVITNIRPDHSRRFGTETNFVRLQQRILSHLKPGGVAVLNADDPLSARLLERLNVPVLTFGMHQAADITAEVVESDVSGQTICLMAGNESAIVRRPTCGLNHVYNCLAAAAAGLSQGLDLVTIARGLDLAASLPGRMERIECGQSFPVWIDSAFRPAQVAAAIHSVRQVVRGRILIAVTMHPEQTPEQRKRIGEIVQKHCQQVVITQTDCSLIRDYEPAHQILDGVGDHDQVRLLPNRMDAIEWLLAEAKPGDGLLITGVGERPIASVGDQNWSVSDRELVQAWLYDNQEKQAPAAANRAQIYRLQDYLQ